MLTRRRFITSATITMGSLSLARPDQMHTMPARKPDPDKPAAEYKFFTQEQVKKLEVIVDQIIPPDENYPGAKDAGVARYLDNALANWLPQNRWDYLAGIEGIDESSNLLFKKDFIELESNQQKSVLERIEQGKVPGSAWAGREGEMFMRLLTNHCMQGYYGDPAYGGNKDQLSWAMIGWMR